MTEFRTHAKAMVKYAMDPDALVYVNMGTVGDVAYFILTEQPLWMDDREYQVRSDMDLDEARQDRKKTVVQYEEDKQVNDAMVDSLVEAAESLR